MKMELVDERSFLKDFLYHFAREYRIKIISKLYDLYKNIRSAKLMWLRWLGDGLY